MQPKENFTHATDGWNQLTGFHISAPLAFLDRASGAVFNQSNVARYAVSYRYAG
jgi:hypothetical protein